MRQLALCLLFIVGNTLAQTPFTVDSILHTVDADDTSHIQKTIDALFIAKKIEYQKGEATAYHKLGYLYFGKKNYPEAFENYYLSSLIRKETGEDEKLAFVYITMAYLLHHTGSYDRAIEYANMAINLNPADSLKCDAFVSLGRSELASGNIVKAIECFKKSAEKRKKKDLYNDLLYLGNSYLKKEMYDSAISTYWKINSVSFGRSNVISDMYQSVAIAHHKKGEYQLAELNYLSAKDYNENGRLFLNYAELLAQTNNLSKAQYFVNLALKFSYDEEHLARTYFAMGKFKECAQIREKVNQEASKDFQQMRQQAAEIARIETNLAKSHEIEALKEANDWKTKMIWTGSLIGFISALCVGKYMWDCRKERAWRIFHNKKIDEFLSRLPGGSGR